MFTVVISSSWIDFLINNYCSSYITIFILKSVLSVMSIATLAFFGYPFAWNIFFQLLPFSLYCFPRSEEGLLYVAYVYGSGFCIHSSSLCLLFGTFNLFTFKVIIDIMILLQFTLLFWVCFCRSFPSPVFLA